MKLLIGGSPCTHWSIAQTKNRETKPEGLGWELFKNYLIALEKFRPNYFLYENNKSMSSAIRKQITKEFGFTPVFINSSKLSAQNRQRLYWVGKREPDGTYSRVPVEQPEDKGILLHDILESGVVWREKGYTLKANYYKSSDTNAMDGGHFPAPMAAEPVRIGTIESDAKNADFDSQQYRVYSPDGKSVTICGQGGGVGAKTGLYAVPIEAEPVSVSYQALGRVRQEDGSWVRMPEAREDGKAAALTSVGARRMVAIPVKAEPVNVTVDGKAATLTARPNGGGVDGPLYAEPVRVGDMPNGAGEVKGSQSGRIYSVDGKGRTLQVAGHIGHAATGLYAVPAGMAWRGRGDSSSYEMRDDQKANAVTADGHQSRLVIEAADGKTYPVYEVRDGKITIKGKQYPIKLADGFYIIRKLTVTECKRLQTVPDDYVFPVSDTQAYKMLGNGWTVDVIAHILSYCPGITEEPLEVLSMYDGMSCGRLALNKLGANIAHYYATEIDKYAIQTTQHNFPDTIQLGDTFQVRSDNFWGKRCDL